MSQIEAPKVLGYAALGSPADNIVASKVVAYFVLVPGESTDDGTNRQGHVHTQIIKRS